MEAFLLVLLLINIYEYWKKTKDLSSFNSKQNTKKKVKYFDTLHIDFCMYNEKKLKEKKTRKTKAFINFSVLHIQFGKQI